MVEAQTRRLKKGVKRKKKKSKAKKKKKKL